jgi:predicted transcriptional regulator
MSRGHDLHLSRRERKIMNVIFRAGTATVADVEAGIPDPPSRTAIRTLLRILEEKGHVRAQRDGRRLVYRPAMSRTRAARAALSGVLGTFFDGSLGDAVAAHLSDPGTALERDELERLRRLIDEARKGAR